MKPNELEQEILRRWNSISAFKKSVENRPRDRAFVFYEGPPTANGKPGLHHVLGRSFKDVITRYKTMRGFRVERRAGWDTHGLPVELQVEKELGLNSKKEIEEYGIAKFNAKCKESVWKYQQEWEQLTERMGFWVDMDNPYITYKPLYIESLWNIIKTAWDKKLLVEGHKVVPRCTRCGTALSSHEVAQGYKDVTDKSVYVKFRVKKASKLTKLKANEAVYFLAWTTTPWTLPGNVALAVGENIEYSLVEKDGENYILASDLAEKVLGEDYNIVQKLEGKDLVDIEYEPLFDALKDIDKNKFVVVPGDFVSTQEGTGIVHTAVMYGEDDYELGKEHDLPRVHTVDEDGKFNERVKEFEGQYVKSKKTEDGIVAKLKKENKLLKVEEYEHSYPFCWRCDTPLIYYAMHSWFIKMGGLKDRLLAANEKVNWTPDYIKDGRFGEWLRELKDWAFSRSRYWGTPLPVWRCDECFAVRVVGSRQDLKELQKPRNSYRVLRHGDAEHNHLDILTGHTPEGDSHGITKEGEKEIKKVAADLKKNGGVDMVIASPMLRTQQTAKIVAKELGVEVQTDERLTELNGGIFEGKPIPQYFEYFGSHQERFVKPAPKGENLAQIQARMLKVIREVEQNHKNKNILLVSHGDPLWLLESAGMGLTVEEAIERRKKDYPETGQLRTLDYAQFPYNKEGELDFHRPFVDDITFPCPTCEDGGTMKRVEDLVDVWFDSGAMPFAQQHYPFGSNSKLETQNSKLAPLAQYPADYIAEGVDQTRGWFYTLLAVATVMDKEPSYKNVVSVGIVLDEKGKKMSKSKGNIVDPEELAQKYGMDAVRWYFYTVNGPGDTKRFSERDVKERWQKFVSTFLNSVKFLRLYSETKPPKNLKLSKNSHVLDKWIYARLKEVAGQTAEYMDSYDILSAARLLNGFLVDDISNWYIRRSRSRLQKPQNPEEKEAAASMLAFVLGEFAKLAAPFVPFSAEYVWQELNADKSKSVHWEDYSVLGKATKEEKDLSKSMDTVRQLVQAGLKLRADAGLKVRQPLGAAAHSASLPETLEEVLKEELNVKNIVPIKDAGNSWPKEEAGAGTVALNTELSTELKREGHAREMVRNIQKLRKDAGLKPQDKVYVFYSLDESLRGDLAEFEEQIAADTNAVSFEAGDIKGTNYDAVSEYQWDGKHEVRLAINKA